MRALRPTRPFLLILLFAAGAAAQCVPPETACAERPLAQELQISLQVPRGTPLRVALQERVRVGNAGEPVAATVTHAIYAFDQEVIPAGSELRGKVTRVDPVTRKRRFFGILNGDFTPARAYEVEFDTLRLPDGQQIAIATEVWPGVAEVVRLVSDPQQEKKRNRLAKAAADAKQQAANTVRGAVQAVKAPGRWARFKRFLARQMPFRRQYIEQGTRFTAELDTPLNFGEVTRTAEQLAALGSPPAQDSSLEARLAAEVSSAAAQPGTPVEAIVTAPLFSEEQKLVFPAGSRLRGEVIHAKTARKLHRNGELRVAFRSIELPNGVVQTVQGSLAGMEVDRAAGLELDREGGARASSGKTRYLATSFAIAAAVLASQREVEPGEPVQTNPGAQAAAGGTGFRLIGAVVTYGVGSPVFATVIGGYGAALSIHRNFLGRGRDVILPVHTPLEISFGKPRPAPDSEDPDH